MAFGTQYGFDPLPAEADIESAWDAVAPDIEVMIGNTAEETRLFIPAVPATARLSTVPAIGHPLAMAISRILTRKVYGAPARAFALRHTRAGGTAYHYVFSWAGPDNEFGAAHAVEIPFLFGSRDARQGGALLGGATLDDIDATARALRSTWARFARGDRMPARGRIAGALDLRRV